MGLRLRFTWWSMSGFFSIRVSPPSNKWNSPSHCIQNPIAPHWILSQSYPPKAYNHIHRCIWQWRQCNVGQRQYPPIRATLYNHSHVTCAWGMQFTCQTWWDTSDVTLHIAHVWRARDWYSIVAICRQWTAHILLAIIIQNSPKLIIF